MEVEEVTEGKGEEEGKKGETRKNNESKKTIEIIFWNIAGLKRKDRNFLDYLEKFDVIDMCETRIKERNWGSMKLSLPKNFIWKCQYAVRVKKKRRSKRIITGVRKEIEEINIKEVKVMYGIQERRLSYTMI